MEQRAAQRSWFALVGTPPKVGHTLVLTIVFDFHLHVLGAGGANTAM